MSFSNPRGTRGRRQPRGRFLRWTNALVMRHVRRRGGHAMGMDILLLTTVGRRTGEERSTPVGWFDGGDGTWVVVASANGAVANPAWYLNLAAHPGAASIELQGERIPVTAEELHGAERAAMWEQIVAQVPRFAGYADTTDREVPLIRLTRRDRA